MTPLHTLACATLTLGGGQRREHPNGQAEHHQAGACVAATVPDVSGSSNKWRGDDLTGVQTRLEAGTFLAPKFEHV